MQSYKRMKRDSGDEITVENKYSGSAGKCDLVTPKNSDGNGIVISEGTTKPPHKRKRSADGKLEYGEQTTPDTKISHSDVTPVEMKTNDPKTVDSKDSEDWGVTAILGTEFTESIPETEAVIDIVVERKEISRLVRDLNALNPIPSLQHLKRVRPDGAVILSLSIEDAPPRGLNTRGLRGKPEVVRVPSRAPLTRAQFAQAQTLWPCNFHPQRVIEEALAPGAGIPPAERTPLRRALRQCLRAMMTPAQQSEPSADTRAAAEAEAAAAMMGLWTARVDCPAARLEAEVAAAMMDMLAARKRTLSETSAEETKESNDEAVAARRGQSGSDLTSAATEDRNTGQHVKEVGEKPRETGLPVAAAAAVHPRSGEVVALAVDCRETHPLQHAAMRLVDLVARARGGGAWPGPLVDGEVLADTAPAPGPRGTDVAYLCTGLDAVLTREPCAMCAMALTHARFRRVFYAQDRPEVGALASRTRLHTLSSLNHRMLAFKGLTPLPATDDDDDDKGTSVK